MCLSFPHPQKAEEITSVICPFWPKLAENQNCYFEAGYLFFGFCCSSLLAPSVAGMVCQAYGLKSSEPQAVVFTSADHTNVFKAGGCVEPC